MPKPLKIPENISQSKEISSDAKLVLSTLLGNAQYGEAEHMSIDSIAHGLGLTPKAVRLALYALELNGRIRVGTAEIEKQFVPIADAVDLACIIDLRIELRKSFDQNGQQAMDLSGEAGDPNELPTDRYIAVMAGAGYELVITPDVEEPPYTFVNVWRLDDDRVRTEHVVQGIQCLSMLDALRWWREYTSEGTLSILDWMATLPAQDSGGAFGESIESIVQLDEASFVAAVSSVCDILPDEAALTSEDASKGILIYHGRRYEIAPDDADPEFVYSYVAENPMDEAVGGEMGTVEVVGQTETTTEGKKPRKKKAVEERLAE